MSFLHRMGWDGIGWDTLHTHTHITHHTPYTIHTLDHTFHTNATFQTDPVDSAYLPLPP